MLRRYGRLHKYLVVIKKYCKVEGVSKEDSLVIASDAIVSLMKLLNSRAVVMYLQYPESSSLLVERCWWMGIILLRIMKITVYFISRLEMVKAELWRISI